MLLVFHIHLQLLIAALDFAGIAVASIGGALHAHRHPRYHYDIIGVFGLALTSALGGGGVRDILLQHGPPLALVDVWYCYVACLAAILTLPLATRIGDRTEKFMLYIDAAAISLFAVSGTARAEGFGIAWLPAIMLGVITAVGGGSLRDVLSGSTPRVFERRQLLRHCCRGHSGHVSPADPAKFSSCVVRRCRRSSRIYPAYPSVSN